jgi:predicted GNAT family acetyltransferase
VNVERLDDAAAFLREAGALLLRDEARHNLILGIAGTIVASPGRYRERSFWLVRDGGEVVGAALRTPPYNLALAQPAEPEAIAVLAQAIADELPGVIGAVPEVDEFGAAWPADARVVREQGVYALHAVAAVPRAPGGSREATADDYELVAGWFDAFVREALPEGEPGTGEERERAIRARLDEVEGGFTLWEDGGEPVSMSGYGGPTPNGMRIGPVYTPPASRGRGYATTLVAEQSARLLAAGREFCFLYTDLANPTSNAIYERIGYERVCDSKQIAFE